MDTLLAAMLDEIEADAAPSGLPYDIVFLGDVVNRGPQTRAVLERLIEGPTNRANRWIVLRGNHEQAVLDALSGASPKDFDRWLRRGGEEMLKSYGASPRDFTPERARNLVGPRHMTFLEKLPFTHIAGTHLFVHAGLEPGVPLVRQRPRALLTIRDAFFRKRHHLPFTVVHGHTPTSGAPLLGPGRIGIDSGACETGVLTCLAIESASPVPRFLQVHSPSTKRPNSQRGRS